MKEKIYFETAVNEGLVEIEDQTFSTGVLGSDWGQEWSRETFLWLACSKAEGEKGRWTLTGPTGIPFPPLRINLSSSSCSSNIATSSSEILSGYSDDSFVGMRVMGSPVDPGG